MSQLHPGFHHRICKDSQYPPESGRYVMYASKSCPYAHRALISHALKGLENVVQIVYPAPVYSINDVEQQTKGFMFGDAGHVLPPNLPYADILRTFEAKSDEEKAEAVTDPFLASFYHNIDIRNTKLSCGLDVTDPILHAKSLKEFYNKVEPTYDGRYTVPMLYDTVTKTIVNNESLEICEIFDSAFDEFASNPSWKAYPGTIEKALIDDVNTTLSAGLTNAVPMAGFANDQIKFVKAVRTIHNYLAQLNNILSKQRFIAGKSFTQVDINALASLLRLNSVYIPLIKLSSSRIQDYEFIFAYMRDIWQNIFNQNAQKSWSEELSLFSTSFIAQGTASINIPVIYPLDFNLPVNRTDL